MNRQIRHKSNLRDRCFDFSKRIIKFTDEFPNQRSGWVIQDQLVRSGCSVGANLVEAQGSVSRKEFRRYFSIALKSAHETQYWIRLARDSLSVNLEIANELLSELDQIIRMIQSNINSLSKKLEA